MFCAAGATHDMPSRWSWVEDPGNITTPHMITNHHKSISIRDVHLYSTFIFHDVITLHVSDSNHSTLGAWSSTSQSVTGIPAPKSGSFVIFHVPYLHVDSQPLKAMISRRTPAVSPSSISPFLKVELKKAKHANHEKNPVLLLSIQPLWLPAGCCTLVGSSNFEVHSLY